MSSRTEKLWERFSAAIIAAPIEHVRALAQSEYGLDPEDDLDVTDDQVRDMVLDLAEGDLGDENGWRRLRAVASALERGGV